MQRFLRFALSLLILLPLLGLAIYFNGQQRIHAPILAHAGFGQTPSQCQAAYGPATWVTADQHLVNPKTRYYVKGGLSIGVGFDEQDHAEQFIFSTANLIKKEFLSEQQQQALLAAFRDGGSWTPGADNDNGPVWQNGEQSYASYIKDSGWLIIMNRKALERHIKALASH